MNYDEIITQCDEKVSVINQQVLELLENKKTFETLKSNVVKAKLVKQVITEEGNIVCENFPHNLSDWQRTILSALGFFGKGEAKTYQIKNWFYGNPNEMNRFYRELSTLDSLGMIVWESKGKRGGTGRIKLASHISLDRVQKTFWKDSGCLSYKQYMEEAAVEQEEAAKRIATPVK